MSAVQVPDETIAVVTFARADDGALVARYVEVRGRVPATRSQTVDALLKLASTLDDQRADLAAAEDGAAA